MVDNQNAAGRSWAWLALAPLVACAVAPLLLQAAGMCGVTGMEMDDAWNRVLLVVGVGLAAWVAWSRGYRSPDALGWTALAHNRAKLLPGFALGLGLVVVLLAVQLSIGAREWRAEPKWWRLVSAVFSAVLVAALEEPLFRGVLLRELRRSLPAVAAIFVQALFFASLHFTHGGPPQAGAGAGAWWWDGFDFLADAAARAADFSVTGRRWALLIVLGSLLGTAALVQGHIWWCAGLHAGLVLGMLGGPALVDYDKGPWTPWLPKDFTLGLDALAALAAVHVWIVVSYAWRRKYS